MWSDPCQQPPLGVGETVEEWRRKDLSTCILEGDPECVPARGETSDLPSALSLLCGKEKVIHGKEYANPRLRRGKSISAL